MPEGFNITDKIEDAIADIRKEISGYPSLIALDQQFATIPDKLHEPMQLAIVGKISSSKSTLVNAILGEAEVVRTGAMEETWNVSWLKYGSPDAPIIVHYKDADRASEKVDRNEWANWANRHRDGNEQLKNAISWIEVTYPHPILQQINIIDTPGLDSFVGIDSQNTIDFLRKVRPDAIVMLFSKNINENTLDEIRNFRQEVGAGFSPINAIGVLSKIDDFWNSDSDQEPIDEGNRIIESLMSQEIVKNTLFKIYPLSAWVALSAYRINEDDLSTFDQLQKLPQEVLNRLFKSAKRFVTDYPDVPVAGSRRAELSGIYGRYGIWLILEHLKNGGSATILDLHKLLLRKSGFDRFLEVLQNHFVQQAATIKVHSLIVWLSAEIRKTTNDYPANAEERFVLGKIIRIMDDLVRMVKLQSNVIDFAKEYYEGRLDLEPEEFEELRRVNGEFGFSCIERTGLDANATPEEMIEMCSQRIRFWRIELNTTGVSFPSLARFMKQMLASYSVLSAEIVSAKHKLESSKNFLFGK
ncbi:MAG: dynamin family protein [Culturomica sp.]|jgi:hypothetical protein|nr:dynamin family protein [Culturomica sp.]